MIGINSGFGPFQALQLQVAARSDPSQKTSDDMRARDTGSDHAEKALEIDLTIHRTPSDHLPKAHHMDFLSQMEAIVSANSTQVTANDLTTDAARLQALQIRQQLESQPFGITNRASQLALALFR